MNRLLDKVLAAFPACHNWLFFVIAFACQVPGSLHPEAVIQAADPARLANQKSALQQKLEQPVSLKWQDIPLREALARLSSSYQVTILLDRRVDPDQPLQFQVNDVELGDALKQLAGQLKLGVSVLSSVAYVGPTTTSEKLATLVAFKRGESEKLPPALRSATLTSAPLRWKELATPRELLRQLATESKLEIVALDEQIPHDLWPAAECATMAWIERLSLLLAGFELTFKIDAKSSTLTLTPFPQRVSIARTFAKPALSDTRFAELSQRFPQLNLKREKGSLRVEGSVEDIEAIEREISQPRTVKGPVKTQDLYDLRIQGKELARVVREIAESQGLELEIAADVPADKLKAIIDLNLKDVTLEKLFQEVAGSVELKAKLQGKRIQILP
jgi:hypothetical protein